MKWGLARKTALRRSKMEVSISKITCAECGVTFWLTENHKERLRDSHETFNCPNGHENYYPEKNDAEKIQERLDEEEKKRSLIVSRDSLDAQLKELERELKELKRNIEDKEEEITEFKESMKQQKATTDELIKSVDASLERLTKISKSK